MLAQLTQPFFHHYTTADGLPSSETYCVTQDKDGYLWFGTDNGVARFDGYEFKIFGIADGLTDVVVFNIVEDSEGKLWFHTYSGRVFYLKNNRFLPYEYNDILVEIKHKYKFFNLVDITPENDLIFQIFQKHIIKVKNTGEISFLFDLKSSSGAIYYREVPGSRFGRQAFIRDFSLYKSKFTSPGLSVKLWNRGFAKEIENIPKKMIRLKAVKDRPFFSPNYFAFRPINEQAGEVLSVVDDQVFYRSASGETTSIVQGESLVNHVIPHPEKGFWIAQGRGRGLTHVYLTDKSSTKSIRLDRVLAGVSTNHIGYDRQGGLWICSQDRGVFYSPFPAMNTYTHQDGDKKSVPIALQILDKDHYLASYDNREIVNNNLRLGHKDFFELEGQIIKRVFYMHYDRNDQVVLTNIGMYHLETGAFYDLKKIIPSSFQPSIYANYTNQYGPAKPNRYYITNTNRGWSFDLDNTSFVSNVRQIAQDSLQRYTITCIGEDYQGRLLLGTMEGLYIRDCSGRFVQDNLCESALNTRIESIDNLSNGGTMISTRGSGLVFVSDRGQNTINATDGLVSDIVRGIHEATNGDIWVNTLSGLSKIRLHPNGQIKTIRSFTTHHGLASNEIHYVDSYKDDLWLASGGGIINFLEPELSTSSPAPIISSLVVDAKVMRSDSLIFSQGQHDLKINFSTINYQMLGHISYRYRLDADETWEYTSNRTVEYPNLPAGDYNFEVQSQNQDRIWSKSVILPLYIPVNWYNHWLAYLSGLLLLVGFIGGIFKLREQRQRKERAIQDQIDELERAAVQAQMNPHFVFNSLNSIQYFILQSDTRQAVYYLSRFASLIRQTLKASVKGIHSLKDEVNMLEIYLSLEKLRFKESFDYHIKVDSNLPTSDIKISPMLVQPFVENAILHGLAEVDSGGLISVSISGTPQELKVIVTDNGCGFDPAASITSDSMGSRITQRRLQKLGGNGSESARKRISIDSNTGEDGRPRGTTVTLIIPSINQ